MPTLPKERTIIITSVVLFILVVVGYTTLKSGSKEEEQEAQYKILFIGTDLTNWNKGFDHHIEKLASSSDPQIIIKADKIIQQSTPLEGQWENTATRTKIKEGDYDAVVLQNALHWTFVETFHEYARKFDTVINEAGAKTVLLMRYELESPGAQARARLQGDCLGHAPIGIIESSHRDIAEELECKVAPFGLAFHQVEIERPDLDWYDADGYHPSIHGTYLAVNVVYATIFNESPEGLTYRPEGVSEDDAEYLQRVAWETVQEYRAQ